MQLEQVEQHFDALDMKALKAVSITPAEVKAAPGVVLQKVCTVYQKVKPFLVIIGGLFFVPRKWRDALTAFLVMLDVICAAEAETTA